MTATTEEAGAPRFRILSLEGGGIMGAFSASALAVFENKTGRRVVDHFDLIAGTSTGGIIAIGLAMGFPARDILSFYEEHGGTIFPSTGFASRFKAGVRHLFAPRHSQEVLRDVVAGLLTKSDGAPYLFGDARVRLVIPAYDGLSGRIYLFKTRHVDRFDNDIGAEAADVAVATAAAPTYFSAAPFPLHNASYVDGGVWANCPALVAVTEAIHFLGVDRRNVDVLNIGTTTAPFNIVKKVGSGVLGWNTGIIDLFMASQVEAHAAISGLLVDGNMHDVNHTVRAGQYALDDSSKVSELVGLGHATATKKEHLDVVRDRFLNGIRAAPFTPVQSS